jgi:hypothetical protein
MIAQAHVRLFRIGEPVPDPVEAACDECRLIKPPRQRESLLKVLAAALIVALQP